MEWDEFLNYEHITDQVAQRKEVLQTNANGPSDTDTVYFQQQLMQYELTLNLNNESINALDNIHNLLLNLKENLNAEFEAIPLQIKKAYKKLEESNHNWPYIFGIPYFKDLNSFSPPPNQDTINMKARNFVSTVNLPPVHLWKSADKTFLLNNVKRFTTQKMKKVSRLHPKTDEMVVNDNLNVKDWAQMPLKNLKDRHGLLECIGMWNSYLNPKFNKKKWTRDEENRLKFLASKYNFQDWEAIARELNTNRSSYQCIAHHQTRLNKDVTKKKWTEEENKQLVKLVRQYKLGEYIPWAKVASHMAGRTKFQVYNHWAYTLQPNIKKGRFTKLEDAIILAGIKKFGTDYGRISRFLKDRTSIQIRNRFNTFLQYQQGFEPWTSEEDVLLVNLVNKFGKGNWSQISKSFRNRNRTQLRHRYTAIMNWNKKNPDKELNIQRRRVHSKIGGPQEIWETIVNESDIEDDNLTEMINEIGLEDVIRYKTQKYAPHILAAKFLDILKDMYVTKDSESELSFSEDEIIGFCKLLGMQLTLLQCLSPFNRNYIENDSTFFEYASSVLQGGSQTESTSRCNNLYNHTENEGNVSACELYDAPTSPGNSTSECDVLNYDTNPALMKINENRVQPLFDHFPLLNTLTSESASVEDLTDDGVFNNFQMSDFDEIDQLLSNTVNGDFFEQCVNSGANIANVPKNNNEEDFEMRHSGNQDMNFNFDHSTAFDTITSNGINESDSEDIDLRYVIDISDNTDRQCPIGVRSHINELMNSSSVLSKDCEIHRLIFYTPPSHTTLVGFYTLLLNLHTLQKSAATIKYLRNVKGMKRGNSSRLAINFSSPESERAAILWKQRFFSIFLWPKLMSINGPEQLNNQQQTVSVKGKRGRKKGFKKTMNLQEKVRQLKQKTRLEKITVKTKIKKRPINQVKEKNTPNTNIENNQRVLRSRRKQN